MYTCSFTGHRAIEPSHERRLSDLVYKAIEYAYSKGCRVFCTGGALGFDTVAARQIILFRMSHPDVKLSLILPCKNQDLHWNKRQRDNYNFTLASADMITYVSDDYTPYCMKKRNSVLAKEGDILIAYVSKSGSGSSQTVRMAEELGKEVYNLYPALEKEGSRI